ncbi:MAG: PilZ domain-containing protein [Terriglobales bacterium]
MDAELYARPEMDLRATHAQLLRLERGEWFRWGAALVVTLALTAGLLVLSLPRASRDAFDQEQLATGMRSLLALVLLFDVFVIYQQAVITRLRRQLTSQLGLIAALDVLNAPAADTDSPFAERRRLPRSRFDQQLWLTTVDGRTTNIQGRIRDITEQGLGAIIPEPLQRDSVVTLKFAVDGCDLAIKAVVRYRRGIHYGFEFIGLADPDAEVLRQIRLRQAAKAQS